eukprot:SAG11_NODE_2165_length_3728_cov_2.060072_5_plen_64_part_00
MNCGTVVYNASAPFTAGMAPEGWADATWFSLLDGAETFLIDSFSSPPQVMIRVIKEFHTTAYL